MKAKYQAIYEETKKKILDGTYKPGDQLPEEVRVCETHGVSRMTVKKAYDMLVRDGLIYRKQGQGSFVLNQPEDDGEIEIQERELRGFSKTQKKGKPGARIVHFKLIFAPEDIAKRLSISAGDPLYDILRVRTVNDKPYVLEHTYMAPSTIPGITEGILKKSVYTYIEKELGLHIGSSQKITRADKSNRTDQKELGLDPTEPVLEVEQTAYLDNGTPFEYSISRHRYDRFKFSVFSIRNNT